MSKGPKELDQANTAASHGTHTRSKDTTPFDNPEEDISNVFQKSAKVENSPRRFRIP